jgi:3-oxoacyl-[acyl-carrier protein] reductase
MVKANVANKAEVENLFKQTIEKFGRVDILVNNAGITRDALLIRMKEEDWDAVLSINLKGVFLCTQEAAKIMMRQRYGRIVNISSVAGVGGNAGQANYSSAKAGVIGLTKTTARELAPRGVTANAVAPGFIKTEMTEKLPEEVKNWVKQMTPLGDMGLPEDIASMVTFLASDDAKYITGQVVNVDGGMFM